MQKKTGSKRISESDVTAYSQLEPSKDQIGISFNFDIECVTCLDLERSYFPDPSIQIYSSIWLFLGMEGRGFLGGSS